MRQVLLRTARNAANGRLPSKIRPYSTKYSPGANAAFNIDEENRVRHFMGIGDLDPVELRHLVLQAFKHKHSVKHGPGLDTRLRHKFDGKTVAMIFNKRSTRTRVSTESAVAMLGGHSMFLGKDDIQLGVNESLLDTSRIISSMTDCIVARVAKHDDIVELARHSSVPVINALSDEWHPLQAVADMLTIYEVFGDGKGEFPQAENRIKVAWVGDANNVCFDLAMACTKMGIDMTVATPKDYAFPELQSQLIHTHANAQKSPGSLKHTLHPGEAIEDANIIVTDTWVSMGQEAEKEKRMKAFKGFQVTEAMAKRAGAHPDWKFMHCMPRHPEEVDNEVFYGDRSLVFQEGENRLWAAIAVLEAFVARKGVIVPDHDRHR